MIKYFEIEYKVYLKLLTHNLYTHLIPTYLHSVLTKLCTTFSVIILVYAFLSSLKALKTFIQTMNIKLLIDPYCL